MMEQKILEHLLVKIKQIEDQYAIALSGKSARDYAEYSEMCGVFKGLSLCKGEIDTMMQRFKEDEDNE
jgi:hypothetical protein